MTRYYLQRHERRPGTRPRSAPVRDAFTKVILVFASPNDALAYAKRISDPDDPFTWFVPMPWPNTTSTPE